MLVQSIYLKIRPNLKHISSEKVFRFSLSIRSIDKQKIIFKKYSQAKCILGGRKRGISSKYVKMIFMCWKRFYSNVLSLYYSELNFFKSLFDTTLKRYEKGK